MGTSFCTTSATWTWGGGAAAASFLAQALRKARAPASRTARTRIAPIPHLLKHDLSPPAFDAHVPGLFVDVLIPAPLSRSLPDMDCGLRPPEAVIARAQACLDCPRRCVTAVCADSSPVVRFQVFGVSDLRIPHPGDAQHSHALLRIAGQESIRNGRATPVGRSRARAAQNSKPAVRTAKSSSEW